MRHHSRLSAVFCSIITAVLLIVTQAHGSVPIATVTSFTGDAVIQSQTKIIPISQIGQPLYTGDVIQTQQGNVQVTFTDDAVMNVSAFTNGLIQEREEKSGFWVFKTISSVRRITCLVGKLRFKSGSSERKNYLQTPSAVCGIRGSDMAVGYDNLNSYLNMFEGEADIVGTMIKGFFDDPGISAATKNAVYKALGEASEATKAADTDLTKAQATIQALQVVKEIATELKENPDATVKEIDGELAGATADASIAAAQVTVSVEMIKEQKALADAAAAKAQAEEDAEAARKAEQAAKEAEKALAEAQKAKEEADRQAEAARIAADARKLEDAQKAAKEAQKEAEKAAKSQQESKTAVDQVVTTTTETTTEETTSVEPDDKDKEKKDKEKKGETTGETTTSVEGKEETTTTVEGKEETTTTVQDDDKTTTTVEGREETTTTVKDDDKTTTTVEVRETTTTVKDKDEKTTTIKDKDEKTTTVKDKDLTTTTAATTTSTRWTTTTSTTSSTTSSSSSTTSSTTTTRCP